MKVKVKFSLSVGMWILAWIMAIVGGFSYDRKFILFAMTASFIGDLSLMWYGMGGRHRKSKYFILGMVSFAVAHLLYSEAFSSRITNVNTDAAFIGVGLAALLLFVSSLVLVFSTGIFLSPMPNTKDKEIFLVGGILYCFILLTNMISIFVYSCSTKTIFAFLPAAGIVLFLVSDYLIAVRELLNRRSKKFQRWIWILYVMGQTMIIIS